MPKPSLNTIEMSYDAENDVVIARPRWTLATEDDIRVWHSAWVEGLRAFKKKPDIVVVLDEFHVQGEAIHLWGGARANLNANHFGISVRVKSNVAVHAAILTSGVTHNSSTAEARDVPAAIEGILAARAQRAVARPSSSSNPIVHR